MAEKLVNYDSKAVVAATKTILVEKGLIPEDCPKETCLNLEVIRLTVISTAVYLVADPPEIARADEWANVTHPNCEACGLLGNSHRCFIVRQYSETGELISAESDWYSTKH